MSNIPQQKLFKAIIESFTEPVVFVNNDHIIQYMNPSAIIKYQNRGGSGLIGRSIFDCHNAESCKMIMELYNAFQNKEKDEQFLKINKENKRVFMRVVRDTEGNVLGYFERYEKVTGEDNEK